MDNVLVQIKSTQIVEHDPIFCSLSDEYPNFFEWLQRIKNDELNRSVYVYQLPGETYGAIAILKREDLDGPQWCTGTITKISTFKVADAYQKQFIGRKLLETIIMECSSDYLYVEVYPSHKMMVNWFIRKGFTVEPYFSSKGEIVLVKTLKQ